MSEAEIIIRAATHAEVKVIKATILAMTEPTVTGSMAEASVDHTVVTESKKQNMRAKPETSDI